MRQRGLDRAARASTQRLSATLGLIVSVAYTCVAVSAQNPKPPSSQPSFPPNTAVEFLAEVVSVVPITQHSGTLRPVSADPHYALTVRVLNDLEEWSCSKGETVCLGVHSPTLTFGSDDVEGRTFGFRVFGRSGRYYHVEAQGDPEVGLSSPTTQPQSHAVHLPGIDVVRFAEQLRLATAATIGDGDHIVIIADPEKEDVRISGATTEQLRVIENMIDEWVTAANVEPYIEFITLQHAKAQTVAERLEEFLKSEDEFVHVTVTCDARTNRVIVAGAAHKQMQSIRSFVSANDLPPVEEWITVNSVPDEYQHIRRHFKALGESYRIGFQGAGEHDDKHFDRIEAISETTGKTTVFFFDTTEIFEQMDHAMSSKARRSAHEALQARYPEITAALLPELKRLLQHEDVHHRTWAVAAISRIPTDEAREMLVDGLIHTSIFTDIELLLAYQDAAKRVGAPMARLVAQRLPTLGQRDRWELISVLGNIGDSHACSVLEDELRTGPTRNRRICYLSLGRIRCRDSMFLLHDALSQNRDNPDDALIWAMGRCGDSAAFDDILRYVKSGSGTVRYSAITALGYLGDKRAIPILIDVVQHDTDHNARCNAIYALGTLRAVEAVPTLIELVTQRGNSSTSVPLMGIYNMDVQYVHENSLVEISTRALSQIGDRCAIPVLRKLLNDDRYYLHENEIAEAAARTGWREMVPDIIARFQTTHQRWANLESDPEEVWQRISPSLRQLTGQTFGEDPAAWARWWAANESTWPTASTSSQPAAELQKAFKGYELYCWRENGQSRFTLLLGTNRNKTASEVFVPLGRTESDWLCISVEGMESLQRELARLPRGEYVTVMSVTHSMSNELSYLTTPKDLAATLREEGQKLGLNIQGLP